MEDRDMCLSPVKRPLHNFSDLCTILRGLNTDQKQISHDWSN
jgi:hypothetical protein